MSRFRNFCFTYNNYPSTELGDNLACKYIIYGKEVGESGTPHLQGCVVFPSGKTLSSVIKLLPGCHVEVCRNLTASIEYCKKEGDYTERGKAPLTQQEKGLNEKDRWKRILEAAQNGEHEWLEENEPQVSILHDKALERARKRARPTPQILDELEHEWWYGEPGTGKTSKALRDYPKAYIKDPQNRWWDGYNGEEVIVIDDFDKYQVSQGGDMKRWLDRYPFQAPVKGGYELIRPKKIIVTSNYHPNEIWEDSITQAAIHRRVTVTKFGSPFRD